MLVLLLIFWQGSICRLLPAGGGLKLKLCADGVAFAGQEPLGTGTGTRTDTGTKVSRAKRSVFLRAGPLQALATVENLER